MTLTLLILGYLAIGYCVVGLWHRYFDDDPDYISIIAITVWFVFPVLVLFVLVENMRMPLISEWLFKPWLKRKK